MSIDLYSKSQQLLESLANSIHDRDQKSINPFCFSINEIHLTEKWLSDLIKEVEQSLK